MGGHPYRLKVGSPECGVRAIIEPELVCGITLSSGLFLTTQWRETVSASGRATLVCRVPQGSEPTEPF
jgi:hypothetical protein